MYHPPTLSILSDPSKAHPFARDLIIQCGRNRLIVTWVTHVTDAWGVAFTTAARADIHPRIVSLNIMRADDFADWPVEPAPPEFVRFRLIELASVWYWARNPDVGGPIAIAPPKGGGHA